MGGGVVSRGILGHILQLVDEAISDDCTKSACQVLSVFGQEHAIILEKLVTILFPVQVCPAGQGCPPSKTFGIVLYPISCPAFVHLGLATLSILKSNLEPLFTIVEDP